MAGATEILILKKGTQSPVASGYGTGPVALDSVALITTPTCLPPSVRPP